MAGVAVAAKAGHAGREVSGVLASAELGKKGTETGSASGAAVEGAAVTVLVPASLSGGCGLVGGLAQGAPDVFFLRIAMEQPDVFLMYFIRARRGVVSPRHSAVLVVTVSVPLCPRVRKGWWSDVGEVILVGVEAVQLPGRQRVFPHVVRCRCWW